MKSQVGMPPLPSNDLCRLVPPPSISVRFFITRLARGIFVPLSLPPLGAFRDSLAHALVSHLAANDAPPPPRADGTLGERGGAGGGASIAGR